MKIRKGFVSNSSSSSFLIVGVYDSELTKELEKLSKENRHNSGYGCEADDDIIFCAGYWGSEEGHYEDFNCVGINCEKELNDGETVPKLAEKFKEKVKQKYDIDVPLEKIKLRFGETSSE